MSRKLTAKSREVLRECVGDLVPVRSPRGEDDDGVHDWLERERCIKALIDAIESLEFEEGDEQAG